MKYLDSSGLSHLWARLKSFFIAKNQVVNNAATTDAGYVLDARVGKSLSDSINTKADKTLATTSANGLMSAADKSKLDAIDAGSNVKSVNGKTGAVSLSKADVGLGNVDNTSDADKPYYKLIGQTETNTNKVGHFHFNDASRSLYKIKNFYAASGEGDYFYLLHKKSDYTITATEHFSNTAGLFTADLSSDCTIATNLISESDPAILTIVREKNDIALADDLTLIFYEDMGRQSNARLKHWKLEIMTFHGKSWEWVTVFERTNVSDSINCLWCGLNPKDNWAYVRTKGIRITIYAATPYSTKSWEFGYNQLRIAGMRLLDSRSSFSPAEALGALDVAGGTVYGETTFQEGISATSYSGATATSSTDGLMSKDDKAKLDTLEERVNSLKSDLADKLYPVGSIYLSVIDIDPGTFIGGRWKRIKDRFLLAAGDTYPAGSEGGSASHSHTLSNNGAACIGNFSDVTAFSTGHRYNWKDYDSGSNMWAWTHNADNAVTSSTNHYNDGSFVSLTGSTDMANSMPPYVTVYVWIRVDYSLDW